ncbi:MAG: efflux RND transporter periplasmic adaptor subunit [Coriobacteriia bacterium]|nr:efflux RND transporter periplasmic adaptor subunit [Coriobacteriia bacterium]
MSKRILAIVLVVAILAGAGWWAWTTYGPNGSEATAGALGGSGTIEADQVAVTPQVSGRVIVAPAQEGVAVKKGDVLYKLDPSLLKLAVDQATAGVSAAKANYKAVKKDDASTKAEIASAKAQWDQAVAAQKMARVQLGFATIASPIDGIVTNLAVRAGENGTPGNTLAIVSDVANLSVTIYVPENRIGEVKVGQAGTISTDSTKEYAGKVTFVSPQAEFTPSSIETKDQRVKLVYQVKLAVTDADAALKQGMPADVVLR